PRAEADAAPPPTPTPPPPARPSPRGVCRFRKPPQKSHELMKVLAHLELRFQPVAAISRRVLEIARDVPARTEAAPRAGNDHRPDLVVVPGVGQRGQYLVNHRLRVTVELFRTVQSNSGYTILLRLKNLGEFHFNPPAENQFVVPPLGRKPRTQIHSVTPTASA